MKSRLSKFPGLHLKKRRQIDPFFCVWHFLLLFSHAMTLPFHVQSYFAVIFLFSNLFSFASFFYCQKTNFLHENNKSFVPFSLSISHVLIDLLCKFQSSRIDSRKSKKKLIWAENPEKAFLRIKICYLDFDAKCENYFVDFDLTWDSKKKKMRENGKGKRLNSLIIYNVSRAITISQTNFPLDVWSKIRMWKRIKVFTFILINSNGHMRLLKIYE